MQNQSPMAGPESPSLTERRRLLLLVEDNPGDAEFISELLNESGWTSYRVVGASKLSDALERIESETPEVVLLDLNLPDSSGLESIRAIRVAAPRAAIVVLTGNEDGELAHRCLSLGAQDYLSKNEVHGKELRRAIGYAVSRQRELEVLEMEQTLARYRSLSSASQGTMVTAALAGSGAIALRSPQIFKAITQDYYALLEPFFLSSSVGNETIKSSKENVATSLGDCNAGPRDLLDVHLAALNQAIVTYPGSAGRAGLVEARLLALEMMGMVVDYYRVGSRRRFYEGPV